MKASLRLTLSLPALLALVSWSPPDPIIDNGSNNNTNGYSVGAPFRGFVTGSSNTIGSMGAPNSYGLVIGNSNEVNLHSSIVTGNSNDISPNVSPTDALTYTRYSGIFGSYNMIPYTCANSLVSGSSNTVTANTSIIAGSANSVSGVSTGSSAANSAAIGLSNQVVSARGYAIGFANTVTNTDAVAIGAGLTSSHVNSTALGKWNAPMGATDLLVVGCGSNDDNRLTALTIRNDGSVIIPGAVSVGGNLDFQGATAQSLTVSGNATLQGTTTAQNLTITGTSSLQGAITATDIEATGSTTLDSLAVSGGSTLAATSASSLTTTGVTSLADTTCQSLDVSGDTVIAGNTTLQGTVTLAQAQGDISMGIYGE